LSLKIYSSGWGRSVVKNAALRQDLEHALKQFFGDFGKEGKAYA
jgi:hypothetical protein